MPLLGEEDEAASTAGDICTHLGHPEGTPRSSGTAMKLLAPHPARAGGGVIPAEGLPGRSCPRPPSRDSLGLIASRRAIGSSETRCARLIVHKLEAVVEAVPAFYLGHTGETDTRLLLTVPLAVSPKASVVRLTIGARFW